MCSLGWGLPDDHQLFKFLKHSVRNAKINTVFSQRKSYKLCNHNEVCLATSLFNVHSIHCEIDLGNLLQSPDQRKTFNCSLNYRMLLTGGSKCNLSPRNHLCFLFTNCQISTIL